MIYLVRALRKKLYKIGWALNEPLRRLSDLQTPCPYDLEMLCISNGPEELEKRIHKDLAKYRVMVSGKEYFEITFNDLWAEWLEAKYGTEYDLGTQSINIPSDRLKSRMKETFDLDQFLAENYEYGEESQFSIDVGLETSQIYADLMAYMRKADMDTALIMTTTRKQLLGALKRHPCGRKTFDNRHYFNLTRSTNFLA
jgi:hypothetical protein